MTRRARRIPSLVTIAVATALVACQGSAPGEGEPPVRLGSAAAPGAGSGAERTPQPAAPAEPFRCEGCNVLLVTFDALRADHLGAYGYEKATSPQLDRLAAESYVFTDAYSQSGTTAASLPSLFTSRFPSTDKILQFRRGFGLKDSEVTLAEILKEHGYSTAAIVGHEFARSKYGLGQGFDVFEDDHPEDELADETIDRALAVMKEQQAPFFTWIHVRQPHHPYESLAADFDELYDAIGDEPTVQRVHRREVFEYFEGKEEAHEYTYAGGRRDLTPTMVRQYVARYDGNIRRGDAAFGRLMRYLTEAGLDGSTIVIVAADHGESMGEHYIFDHNVLYHGVLHTPLMVRLPHRTAEVRDYPVMNVDIFPTVLRMLDLSADVPIRGRDLFDGDRADYVQFAEYSNAKAVKIGRYKYYLRRKGGPVLHDVVADPDEANDLSEAEPELAESMDRLVRSMTVPREKNELMEHLRALGYLE